MGNLLTKKFILERQNHPAWLLLASGRGPLVLGCLKPLFEKGAQEIPLEDAREQLSELLSEHANNSDFDIATDDFRALARRELRDWIRRGLLVERGGSILATDALQSAFRFVEGLEGLEGRVMTSTASRLATVQQKIEKLETDLNPDQANRIHYLEEKLARLQAELKRVRAGDFEVLEGDRAHEEVREVYSLAMSLRADFRRVEDSYREADRTLRQSIISDEQNRGEVVDKLLSTNDALLETPEGRVFNGFFQQIQQSTELDAMRVRLRSILGNPTGAKALDKKQAADLRWLVSRLVEESENVIAARSRSERDVKGFVKTGLASEHHRVGNLLHSIFETVLKIDWSRAAVRRSDGPFPPIAPAQPTLPAPERICFKSLEEAEEASLNLEQQHGSLDALQESFLENSRELDRAGLFHATLRHLRETGRPHTIGELARALPPEYDIESLVYWLTLAREAEIEFAGAAEEVELVAKSGEEVTRFVVPAVALTAAALASIAYETLE